MADTGRKLPAEPLTKDEVRALLAQCSRRAPTGVRDRALITVMYRAGLRLEEALALKPADIDAANGIVRVLHGKGDRARPVGIDDGALAVVQLWVDERKRLGLKNGKLFCTLAGKPLSDSQVRQMVRRRAANAGITKRVHPHGLRHTHAAELAAEGVPVNVIQAQLGHTSLATTDIYLRHIAPADVIALGRSRHWQDAPVERAKPAGPAAPAPAAKAAPAAPPQQIPADAAADPGVLASADYSEEIEDGPDGYAEDELDQEFGAE